jgi:hypothetical protein
MYRRLIHDGGRIAVRLCASVSCIWRPSRARSYQPRQLHALAGRTRPLDGDADL